MVSFGSLFSGVGLIDLGLINAGWSLEYQVENDRGCVRRLEARFPGVRRFLDVSTVRGRDLPATDLIAGGFPCTDVSTAAGGGARGLDGDRSGLWWHYARILYELGPRRPRWVVVENVSNLLRHGIEVVVGTLSDLGYDAEWDVVSAQAIGAPHRRERMWVVAWDRRRVALADPDGERCGVVGPRVELEPAHAVGDDAHGRGAPLARFFDAADIAAWRRARAPQTWPRGCAGPEPGVGGAAHGSAAGLDRPPERWERGVRRTMTSAEGLILRSAGQPRTPRLHALGNGAVPLFLEWIGHRIILADGTGRRTSSQGETR